MRITTLGCSASITGELRTTCYQVDDDILIDAGSGAGELSLAQSIAVNFVFLTHSHLDHCAFLPMLADAAGSFRDAPLTIYALPETIAALNQHMFSGRLWPDYTLLPTPEHPYIRFRPIKPGETVELGGRKITPLPANHVVPAVGFHVDSGKGSLVFSGDTTTCDALWESVNRIRNLEYLIVETAFSNAEKELAVVSKHYCPSLLAEELCKLKLDPKIFITHLKPGEIELTMQEVSECVRNFVPKMLQNGQVFEF